MTWHLSANNICNGCNTRPTLNNLLPSHSTLRSNRSTTSTTMTMDLSPVEERGRVSERSLNTNISSSASLSSSRRRKGNSASGNRPSSTKNRTNSTSSSSVSAGSGDKHMINKQRKENEMVSPSGNRRKSEEDERNGGRQQRTHSSNGKRRSRRNLAAHDDQYGDDEAPKNNADQTKYNNTASNNKARNENGVFIVVTETAHERMRKVSLLSQSDPVDKKSSKTKEKEENLTLSTECSSPKFEEPSVSHDVNDDADRLQQPQIIQEGPGSHEIGDGDVDDDDDISFEFEDLRRHHDDRNKADPTSGQQQKPPHHGSSASMDDVGDLVPPKTRLGQSISGDFVPPSALHSEDTIRRRRAKSLDDHECLVELEFDTREQMHNSTQTGGFDFFAAAFEDDDDAGNGKTNVNSDDADVCNVKDNNNAAEDSDKAQIIRRGMEVRGVICPSDKQRRLMRKVSALGMEDPVFGNISEQVKPTHASNIFDDMDFADVPDDMKDMLSLASDRTDVVDLDDEIIESPQRRVKGTDRSSAAMHASSSKGFPTVALHQSTSSLPPLGLDPDAIPRSPNFAKKPRSPSSQKKPTGSNQRETSTPAISTSKSQMKEKKGLPNSKGKPFQAPYVPPTGSFDHTKKKPGKNRSNGGSAAIVRDDVLAAQVNAMFQQSMPVLNTSGLNISTSSLLNESFNTTSSSGYNKHSTYKPPPSPLMQQQQQKQLKHAQNQALPPPARTRETRKSTGAPSSRRKVGNSSMLGSPTTGGYQRKKKSFEVEFGQDVDTTDLNNKTSNKKAAVVSPVYVPPGVELDRKTKRNAASSKISSRTDDAVKNAATSSKKKSGRKTAPTSTNKNRKTTTKAGKS